MTTPTFTFGIEIECYVPEGSNATLAAAAITARGVPCFAETWNHGIRPHWKIVTDGSLNDYTRGIEVVSPILTGADGLAAAAKVYDALSDLGCTVSRSCGLHVHVGVGDFEMSFFRNLLKMYVHFEPVIDAFLPESRRASVNSFCRSITSIAVDRIDNATSLDALLSLYPSYGDQRKYYKLNMLAYRSYKTVEFRHHSGTLDARKARNWIMLCLRVVAAARDGNTGISTSITSTDSDQINRARWGSKTYLVGQMMLRPEGVTRSEALAATGWTTIGLPDQAQACGLTYTTQRSGRNVRYFARHVASVATTPTLEGLLATIDAEPEEREYFRARTANLSGPVAWAA